MVFRQKSPAFYELDLWHTLAMDFGPLFLSGSLDDQPVLTMADPTASSIDIVSFEVSFRQQKRPTHFLQSPYRVFKKAKNGGIDVNR